MTQEPAGPSIEQQIIDADFDLKEKFHHVLSEYLKSREAPETIASAVVSECTPAIDHVARLRAEELRQSLMGTNAYQRVIEFRDKVTATLRQSTYESSIDAVVKNRLK